MEFEEYVKKSTPNLAVDILQTVLQRLAHIGVESIDDLALVQENDLLDILPPVKARKLLHSWICKVPYKLQYFPVRGRAQALRYIVADLGLELQEELVDMKDWPALKPKTPLGQLPVFHDGDLHLGQSNAILRYIARKHALYGKNDREAALIDMINDQQEDIRLTYLRLIYQEYDTGKEAYIKNLPTHLATLEKVLGENKAGAGFFVGDKISFVDYTIFDLLDNFVILAPHSLDGFPKLKGFHSRIASRDKIAKYRTTDAFKKTPINGNGKQ